jgi:hypothetical protein
MVWAPERMRDSLQSYVTASLGAEANKVAAAQTVPYWYSAEKDCASAEMDQASAAEDGCMVYDFVLALASVGLMLVPGVMEELQHRRSRQRP